MNNITPAKIHAMVASAFNVCCGGPDCAYPNGMRPMDAELLDAAEQIRLLTLYRDSGKNGFSVAEIQGAIDALSA